jgi:uncharacterized protein YceH (UPF0502 family)
MSIPRSVQIVQLNFVGVSVGVGEFGEQDAIRAAEAENQVEALKKENAELRARLEAAGLH